MGVAPAIVVILSFEVHGAYEFINIIIVTKKVNKQE